MKTLLLLACLCTLPAARAEFRTWTGKHGSSIQAEFMVRQMDEVQLKTQDGAIKRVAFEQLSETDREYVQLRQPPTIDVAVDPNQNFVDQSVTRRGFKNGYEILDFEITLTRKSRESYDLPLTVELYIIAQNEINHDYVLARRTTRRVYFSEKRNKQVIKPGALTLQQTEARSNDELSYVGYVIILRDKADTPLLVKSNKASFESGAANLTKAREGVLLNRDTLAPRK